MKTATAPLPPCVRSKVLDQLRERIRYLHYSLPTEQAYVHWVRAFIRFHGVRPATLGSSEVEAFLSWLAGEQRKVSVSIVRHWRPCCSSTAVLCGSALASGDRKTSAVAALPVVLTPDEVVRILRFSGRRASFVRPSSVERACGSVRFATAGQGSGFRSARSSCRRERAQGSTLDVTRKAWHPACASSCRVHGHGG